jgi:hypothetical protein
MTYWIRRIHSWLGLLNFSLLAIFGIAGLVVTLEIPDIFHQARGPSVEFRDFSAPGSASDREVGQLLARLLAPEHAGAPEVSRNDSNQLVADFYNVNGLVRATLLPGEQRVQVETFRTNVWHFLDNAHTTTIADGTSDPVVRAWAWYIEFAIWSLIALAASGLWLGIGTRWRYRWTPVSLAAGGILFAALYWLEK